jgi:predicted PurR-regulated permease PerM
MPTDFVAPNGSAAQNVRRRAESWIAASIIVALALLCILVLLPFLSAALWALVLCFTTWPVFLRLDYILGGRRALSALTATLLLIATIALPVSILGSTLAENVPSLISATQKLVQEGPPRLPDWVSRTPLIGSRISDYWNYLGDSASNRMQELTKLLPATKTIVLRGGSALARGILQILLSLLMAFFFYRDGQTVANRFSAAIHRIAGERGDQLLDLAGATVRAVVYGVLGTALLQGIAAAIGFAIARVPGAVSLGFVTFLLSFLPGGPLIVAAPAAFWLYRQGSIGWAVFVMLWGAMVGMLDNVVKPAIISRGSSTPMILLMLGLFGGAIAFGVIGMFLGPTLVALGYGMLSQWSETTGGT